MKRRELLLAAASSAATSALPADAANQAASHHHDTGSNPLIDSALSCVKTGELCQSHCFDLFAQGDNSVASCARSVEALRAACSALSVLAAQKSPFLPRYAAVTKEVCRSCEDECRKHADKHAPCKACADACATCYRECERIAT